MSDQIKQFWQSVRLWSKRYPWAYPIIAILIVYHALPLTYFEQDEWQAFETYITTGHRPLTECLVIQRPLTCVVNTLEWRAFGTHAAAYGVFSLLLIMAISYFFYRLLRKLELPTYKAVVAASLFPIFAAGAQAITWFGAFSASLPNFLFALIAVDCFIEAIKQSSWRWQLASLVSLLVSLYFKEESLWVIPVLLTTWWVFGYLRLKQRRPRQKSLIRYLGPLVATAVIYLLLERVRQLHTPAFSGLVSTTDSGRYIVDVFQSIFLLPFQHLSHVLVGPENIISFSQYLGISIGDLSAFVSTLLLLFFAGLLYFNRSSYRPTIVLLVVWAVFGFIAYAVFGKSPEFLEGRYYFAAQAPVVVLLVIGLLPDKVPSLSSLNTVTVAVLVLLVGFNVCLDFQRMGRSLAIAEERKNILHFIQKATGPLPKRAIIYTETTNYGYAGQAAFLLPFQNGLGTTLRVLYQGNKQDYRALAKKQAYLWNLLNEGYDEVDGVGFGYFRDYDKMVAAYRANHLPADAVFTFRYEGKKITNTTHLVSGRLGLEGKTLVPIDRTGWKLTTSNDHGVDDRHGAEKILDDNPKSDWAVPHQFGDYIEVDLGKPVGNVVGVQLTTADGNSFPRKYKFESSPDGRKWTTDFTDLGHLVDNDKTPILFGPKTIQKFRIKITDTQPTIFAWSVSDLNVMVTE